MNAENHNKNWERYFNCVLPGILITRSAGVTKPTRFIKNKAASKYNFIFNFKYFTLD